MSDCWPAFTAAAAAGAHMVIGVNERSPRSMGELFNTFEGV
jgi:hypothetical protein